jgi:MHS family shikimate/dehydroshikimate transporter-like MFS transporter
MIANSEEATLPAAPEIEVGARRRALLAAAAGSVLEWYDFNSYAAAAALVFGKQFFPNVDPLAGTMLAFGTYAVGFFARPVGGLIIANLGDRLGRKPMLVTALLLMGLSTGVIGLLPSYETIGVTAPLLLILMRLLQGLGAGAEISGAALLASEGASRHRSLFAAIPFAGVDVGTLLATGTFALATTLMSADSFQAWGWRIPFLASFILLPIAFLIRRRVPESQEYEQQANELKTHATPLFELLRNDWRGVLIAMGTVFGVSLAYIFQVYAISYVTTILKVSRSVPLTALTVASACAIPVLVLFGALVDKIGPRRILIVTSVVAIAYAFPFFWLLDTRDPFLIGLAIVVGMVLVNRTFVAGQVSFAMQLFPVGVRFSGMATSREIVTAFIAGPLPLVAIWLVGLAGDSWPVAILMMVMGLVSAIAAITARGRVR